MQKEELRRLRALPATKEMMEKGKHFEEVKEKYWYNNSTYMRIIPEYDLLIRVQNLNGYLKVAAFLPEWMRKDIKTPAYEIFVNVAGEEWISRVLDEKGKEVRWSSAMAFNLPEQGNWSWNLHCEKIYANHDAMQSLSRLTFLVACVVAIWIICNECISILENLKDMNVKIPPFLQPLLRNIRSQAEAKVGIEEGVPNENKQQRN